MSIENLLSRLDKVRRRGNNKWMASCPCHTDKTPSLSIKDDNGTILLHCFSQECSAHEICSTIGMEVIDLFPPSDNYDAQQSGGKKLFHDSAQVLECLAFETLVVLVTAEDMANKRTITEENHERLMQSIQRINAALEYTKRMM